MRYTNLITDKSESAARLAAALSLAMNGLLRISVPQTNRNETRQISCGLSMLARKVPSSGFEIAAPIWRVKTKMPLENETKNERLVSVASWRGFSKLAYKFYSFADLAIGG